MPKNRVNSFLSKKRNLIIVSALIAIIFWFSITIVENPESQRVITGIPVYVDTSGTVIEEQGLNVVGTNVETASIKISGANYVVNSIMPSDISLTPILEGVNASGKYSLKLNAANITGEKIVIESISPETIDVEFDYIDTISFQVQIKVKNASAKKGLVLGPERFTNSEDAYLEVSGPRSIVSQIASVYAVAKADKNEKLSATTSYDAKIELRDADDKKISSDSLKLSFEKISVSVPVYKTKKVPVKCTYTNQPNDFKPKTKISVSEEVIKEIEIEGAPDIIDKTDYIELEAIDFKEIYKGCPPIEKKFVLPSGIFIVDDFESATVEISSSELKNKTFKLSKVVAINNSNNYKVSLNNKFEVKICGEKSVIDNLTSSDLYAQVDLEGKEIGEQSLAVIVKSSKKDNIWQLNDYNAKVNVKK